MEVYNNIDDNLPLEELEETNKIIVIIGSSGSGKTTLANKLNKTLNIPKLITTTTRPMRKDENHGVDYYFVGENTFNEMSDNNTFLEENVYSGYRYGLTNNEINKHENDLCYVISDVNGARSIANTYPDRVMIFWMRSKPTTLIKRLFTRGEKISIIFKRLINGLKKREFISPVKMFTDVTFTELSASKPIVDNFAIIYYRLLVEEYNSNSIYLKKLEMQQKNRKGEF